MRPLRRINENISIDNKLCARSSPVMTKLISKLGSQVVHRKQIHYNFPWLSILDQLFEGQDYVLVGNSFRRFTGFGVSEESKRITQFRLDAIADWQNAIRIEKEKPEVDGIIMTVPVFWKWHGITFFYYDLEQPICNDKGYTGQHQISGVALSTEDYETLSIFSSKAITNKNAWDVWNSGKYSKEEFKNLMDFGLFESKLFQEPKGFKQRGNYYYIIDNQNDYDEFLEGEYDGKTKLPVYHSTYQLDGLDNRPLHEWALEHQANVVGHVTVYYKDYGRTPDMKEFDLNIPIEEITYLAVDTDELYDPNAYLE